jgi:hypothetical protein
MSIYSDIDTFYYFWNKILEKTQVNMIKML